jgi:hypothetical protein
MLASQPMTPPMTNHKMIPIFPSPFPHPNKTGMDAGIPWRLKPQFMPAWRARW